jgi:cobalt ECF transporter T component CbiQ
MNRWRTFLESNLFHFSEAIQNSIFAEETASLPGWLQSMDPRVKLVGLLMLVVTCSFSTAIVPILFILLFSIVLAGGSGLFSQGFLVRLGFFIPLYTAVIAIPALFLTPGEPFFRIPFLNWIITVQGLRTGVLLVTRVTTTVSLVLLLVLTTRWSVLLKALRSIGIPHIFVFMLAMTYRYIFVLLHSVTSLFLARQSRRVGPEAWRNARQWLGALSGVLLGKSYSLSSEIYLAMVSRGFRGEPVLMGDFRTRRSDWMWMLSFVALSAMILWGHAVL